MPYLLTAALALFGAPPLAAWLLHSPYAAWLQDWRSSPAVTELLGNPDWLLLAVFLLACRGAADLLLAASRGLSGTLLGAADGVAGRYVLHELPRERNTGAARKAP